MNRKTVSINAACKLVGVSRRTIYNWKAKGKIEYVRTASGSMRIFVDTLWRDADSAPSKMVPKVQAQPTKPVEKQDFSQGAQDADKPPTSCE